MLHCLGAQCSLLRWRILLGQVGFESHLMAEFIIEPHLQDEFDLVNLASRAGTKLSPAASKILSAIIVAKTGVPIPPVVLDELGKHISKQRSTMLIFKGIADFLAWMRSSQQNYESCCRSAISHAVIGSHDYAFGALRFAANINDDWARHHHIYGLIHGVNGNYNEARYELERALGAEPYHETQLRIRLALDELPPSA